MQDGKIVGAVTHVLVNDPTRGDGIFIENMLAVAGGSLARQFCCCLFLILYAMMKQKKEGTKNEKDNWEDSDYFRWISLC